MKFFVAWLAIVACVLAQDSTQRKRDVTCIAPLVCSLDEDGVLTISGSGDMPDKQFDRNKDIKSVIIQGEVTSIGANAFRECSNLKTITFSDSIESIGFQAFSETGLTSVTIPDAVTEIKGYTFQSCMSLSSMIIGRLVEKIDNYALSYCTNLTSLIFLGAKEPTFGIKVFLETESVKVYVFNDFEGTIFGGKNISRTLYHITYELNGGEAENPTWENAESGSFALNNPTIDKPGYTGVFLGWTGSNGNTPETSVIVNPGAEVKDLNFIANWEVLSYTISYDLQGGDLASGETNPTTYNVITPNFTLKNPQKEGYTFEGWTGSDITTLTVSVTIPTGSAGDRTYIANWLVINYTISYDLQGGSVDSENPTIYNIETADFTLNNPTKSGYVFTGWTGTDLSEPSTNVTILKGATEDRNYTANWMFIDLSDLSDSAHHKLSVGAIAGSVIVLMITNYLQRP